MSNNPSFPTSGNLYQFPALNTGVLYINGKKFEEYINELVFEDQLEQDEITEIKLLLEYLDTTGLNSAWLVNNGNTNETLRASITALQNKLANIDTTALTESSVLTNDNRNSVLKTAIDTAATDLTALTTRVTTAETDIDNLETRMTTAETDINNLETSMTTAETDIDNLETRMTTAETDINNLETSMTTAETDIDNLETRMSTAEGDIDGVETKTRFITEATVVGSGTSNYSTYKTKVGPTGMEGGGAFIEMNMKNAPEGELIGYSIQSNFNVSSTDNYDVNESFYSHYDGRLTLLADAIRIQAADQVRIGTFAGRDGFSEMDIKIGGRGNKVNIGSVDDQNLTGPITEIWIGHDGGTTGRNTETSLEGNLYIGNGYFPQLDKSNAITVASLIAFMSSGPPSWVLGFASGATGFPYSDVWTMKGGFAGSNKKGDVETSNSLILEELYVINKSILNLTPKVGFFMAKADYSYTALIGDHRTQTFEGDIVLRNNNITSSSVDWLFTDADDKCNVVRVGGDDGILIHQGASDDGAPLKIINSCNGSIILSLDDDGTKSFATPGIEIFPWDNDGVFGTQTRIGLYPLVTPTGSQQFEVNQQINRDGIVVQYYTLQGTTKNVINYNSINTPGTITGINLVGSSSVSTPSILISGNYTGDTTNRLYKNADNKLFWNGVEIRPNLGGGGGGIEYYIPLASNVTNPAPNPTAQIATETYTNAPQRTITQSTTAVATGLRMARYLTGLIDKESNPFVKGLQTIKQYLTWSENNTVGQLYGEAWFQAEATNGDFVYDKIYPGGVESQGTKVLNGTPILAPNGLFNLSVGKVVFPGLFIDTFSGLTMTLKCRLEARTNGTWATLQTSTAEISYSVDNQYNQTLTFTEDFIHNQTTKTNAPTAYRFVLFVSSGDNTGAFVQTGAGSTGSDLGAYKLGSTSGTTASIRILLYDGENAKQTITHTTTPSLVPIDLPISPLYEIGAFNGGRLAFDIFMYQPSGAVNANHQMTFFFGEGTISHIESTSTIPDPIPTLAQVLNSGATASQSIDMDGNAITGITTLEGSSGGNWNVKEISAGNGVSVSDSSGTYTIENTGVLSVAPAIIVGGSAGISVTTTSGAVTLVNTGIVGITQGTGIAVSTTGGIATVSSTVTPGSSFAREQLYATNHVGVVQLKPSYYMNKWLSTSHEISEIFVSQDGRNCAYIADGGYIKYSSDYGATWNNSNLSANLWTGICGNSTGKIMYVIRQDGYTGSPPNLIYNPRLYASYDYAATWVEVALNKTQGTANTWYGRYVNQIRCSADGLVIAVCILNTTALNNIPNNGTIYVSIDGGLTWTIRSVTATASTVADLCMSANGAIMFAAVSGILGTNEQGDNGTGGIYRSYDYGTTWARVRTKVTAGAFFWGIVKCDATARFLVACELTNDFSVAPAGQIQTSEDFGGNWNWYGDALAKGARSAFVSSGGNLMITIHNPEYNSRIRYSQDYGRSWTTAISFNTIIGASTLGKIASNYDGSVILMHDLASTPRLHRFIDQKDTLTYDYSLHYAGLLTAENNSSIYNLSWANIVGPIDLETHNIRYEIFISFNYSAGPIDGGVAFQMGLNGVDSTGYPPPLDTRRRTAVTNWTNTIVNGQANPDTAQEFNQTFIDRFYCGERRASTWTLQFRNRVHMKGEISMNRRLNAEVGAGIADNSVNSRIIVNQFNCEHFVDAGTDDWFIYAEAGTNNAEQYNRIHGTALWNARANNLWATSLASGITSINLYMQSIEAPGTYSPRGAEVQFRIYKENKGVVS